MAAPLLIRTENKFVSSLYYRLINNLSGTADKQWVKIKCILHADRTGIDFDNLKEKYRDAH